MMDKKVVLLEWLTKIEKDGIPSKTIFKMMWTDVIKIIREKFKANQSWEEMETFVKKNKETFSGENTMAGPDAAQKVFKQIGDKIWSINRKI